MGYLKNTETYPTKYKKPCLSVCDQLKYAYDTWFLGGRTLINYIKP